MRVLKIEGNTVVFIYDHTTPSKPAIGDNFLIRETGSNDGLIVQVISFESFEYPSLSEVLLRRMMEDSYGDGSVTIEMVEDGLANPDNFALCEAKIRRRLKKHKWHPWDGWIPSRNVVIQKIPSDEVLKECGMGRPYKPLFIGKTSDGHAVNIEGRFFEKVNVITALKGMGKSHLAKVLLLQVQKHGMPCVVFDVNREYSKLPKIKFDREGDRINILEAGIVPLEAGKNLRVSVETFGKRALLALFNSLSVTENTANQFESKVSQIFEQLEKWDEDAKEGRVVGERPFLTLSI